MDLFEYNSNPARVIFGYGTITKVPAELARLGLKLPLVLCSPRRIDHADTLRIILDGQIAGVFSEATMHTPLDVTNKALAYVKGLKPDCVVSIGGGSTTGLGKAISIRTGLLHLCLPTSRTTKC